MGLRPGHRSPDSLGLISLNGTVIAPGRTGPWRAPVEHRRRMASVSRMRENRMHGSTGRGWKGSSRHRASPSPNQPHSLGLPRLGLSLGTRRTSSGATSCAITRRCPTTSCRAVDVHGVCLVDESSTPPPASSAPPPRPPTAADPALIPLTRVMFWFEVACVGCDLLGDEGSSLRADLPRRLHPPAPGRRPPPAPLLVCCDLKTTWTARRGPQCQNVTPGGATCE